MGNRPFTDEGVRKKGKKKSMERKRRDIPQHNLFHNRYTLIKGALEFSNYIIEDISFFNQPGRKFTRLTFRNCQFTKDFELTGNFEAQKLAFIECDFEMDATFEKLGLNDPDKNRGSTWHVDPTLYLKKCTIKGLLSMLSELEGSVSVEQSAIGVFMCQQKATNFIVSECDIRKMKIAETKMSEGIWLTSNTIKNLTMETIVCGRYRIANNTFDQLNFHGSMNHNRADGLATFHSNRINNCHIEISPTFKGAYELIGNAFRNGVITSHEDDVMFADTYQTRENTKPRFSPIDFEESLKPIAIMELRDNLIESSLIIENEVPLKLLNIHLPPSNKGMLHINGAIVEKLKITGTIQGATLNVDFSNICHVEIFKLMNYGNIFFSNYIPVVSTRPAKFKLIYSNMGAAELSIFNLAGNEVEIVHSNLSNIKFSEVHWFGERNLNEIDEEAVIKKPYLVPERNSDLNDIFGQLRRAAEKSGDKTMTVYFRYLEHKYQLKVLRLSKRFFHQERLLLTLNLSNKFGTDWFRPIRLAVVAVVLCYLLIIASFYLGGPFGPSYCEAMVKYSFAIPQLLNPAHSLSTIFDYKQHPELLHRLSFLSYFFDLLVRAAVSYLLVQTIIAFRKQSN